ncbi:hypothetical protein FSG20_023000 [Escherichia coli]|nr:hypothetical protein [Escherichia coli]
MLTPAKFGTNITANIHSARRRPLSHPGATNLIIFAFILGGFYSPACAF